MFSEWPLLKNNHLLGTVVQMLEQGDLRGHVDAPKVTGGPRRRRGETHAG